MNVPQHFLGALLLTGSILFMTTAAAQSPAQPTPAGTTPSKLPLLDAPGSGYWQQRQFSPRQRLQPKLLPQAIPDVPPFAVEPPQVKISPPVLDEAFWQKPLRLLPE